MFLYLIYSTLTIILSNTTITTTTITLITSLTILTLCPSLALGLLQPEMHTNIIIQPRPILNLQFLHSKPLFHQSLPNKKLHRMISILVLLRREPQFFIISSPMSIFLGLQISHQ